MSSLKLLNNKFDAANIAPIAQQISGKNLREKINLKYLFVFLPAGKSARRTSQCRSDRTNVLVIGLRFQRQLALDNRLRELIQNFLLVVLEHLQDLLRQL
jgi:hypothetical protein